MPVLIIPALAPTEVQLALVLLFFPILVSSFDIDIFGKFNSLELIVQIVISPEVKLFSLLFNCVWIFDVKLFKYPISVDVTPTTMSCFVIKSVFTEEIVA